MEGKFLFGRKTNALLAWLLFCGLSLIALYAFLRHVDPEAPVGMIVIFVTGVLICLASGLFLYAENSACICLGEDTIQARYFLFGRLDCRMEDVAFALPQGNTLTILLKNGKRHVIMGLENPWELGTYICWRSWSAETERPAAIRLELSRTQAARKKELRRVIAGSVWLFAGVLLAVLLTGGRELSDFGLRDWILFAGMGVIELLTLAGVFWAANRCGKRMLSIEWLKYRLRGAIILACPLPSGNITAVLTDAYNMGRAVVCRFPKDESAYYCVQEFAEDFALETVYTSGIYDNKNALPWDGLSELIDITAQFSASPAGRG